jgi:hypothetical protein
MLARGYGTDAVPDVLGVAVPGRARAADGELASIVDLAERASHGSALVAIAGTGSASAARGGAGALISQIESAVPVNAPVVAGSVPGGLFLDQSVLERARLTGQTVVDALFDATLPDGAPAVRDAFQGFAVSFARYC